MLEKKLGDAVIFGRRDRACLSGRLNASLRARASQYTVVRSFSITSSLFAPFRSSVQPANRVLYFFCDYQKQLNQIKMFVKVREKKEKTFRVQCKNVLTWITTLSKPDYPSSADCCCSGRGHHWINRCRPRRSGQDRQVREREL